MSDTFQSSEPRLTQSLVSDITADNLNFLFIGPSGVGKTHAAALLMPPTLFLDCEGGLRTVVRLNNPPYSARAKQVNVRKLCTAASGTSVIKNPIDIIQHAVHPLTKGEPTGFNSLCVDSIGALGDLVLRFVQGPDPSEKQILRNYGRAIDSLKQLVYYLNELPIHVIYTALETAVNNEDGTLNQFVPAVIGKDTFARQLPALVDEVWWLTVKTRIEKGGQRTSVRSILTAPSGIRVGKDRTGVLTVEQPLDFEALRVALRLHEELPSPPPKEVLVTKSTTLAAPQRPRLVARNTPQPEDVQS